MSWQLATVLVAAIAHVQGHPQPAIVDQSPNERSAAAIERRFDGCGSDRLTCNGEAALIPSTTPKAVCLKLMDSLMDNEIRTEPRDHCYTEHQGEYAGSRCCVSWSKEVPRGTPYTELKTITGMIFNECDARYSDDLHISGQAHDIKVGGVCMSVCLSPGPKGCGA